MRRTRLVELPEARWAAASLALFLAGLAAQLAGGPTGLWWALYLACYVTGGWEPALSGLRALRDKTLDVDLLMVVAAIGAASIGQVMDGGLLIVIFATSGALEAFATARTEDSVRGLLDLTPDTATRVGRGSPPGRGGSGPGLDPGDADPAEEDPAEEAEEIVPVAELAVGDVILVRPGERISADGVVVAGASEVDQATITGEPLPVDKRDGDEVFAGTRNGTGALWVRVQRPAAEFVAARIAALVEQAARTKAKTQLFIEKVEQRYSVGMVTATLGLFAIPLAWGAPLEPTLLRAMTFMIVASPCAVVLSTMPPLLAAIANAGRHGVLVKSAVVMERLGASTVVAFDKTGTLTRGTPELAEIRVLPGTGLTPDELLALAAAAEHPSEHPLAAAVVRAARDRTLPVPEVQEFSALPGQGVRGRVAGHLVQVGSPTALLTGGTADGADDTAAGVVAELQQQGHTVVVVLCDQRPVGVLGISDEIRDEAAGAVTAVTQLTATAPVLLTGDNPTTAARLAERVGISDVRAGLLPEDKVSAIRQLEAGGERVTVVGDGINDAPALAAAHAGVAMGGTRSELTLRTADVVVVRDDLSTIPAAIELSRRARRVVAANLVIAGTFIAGLVTWDLIWYLPLPLGVAGHEGSTLLVALNGLRLLRRAAWQRALRTAGQANRATAGQANRATAGQANRATAGQANRATAGQAGGDSPAESEPRIDLGKGKDTGCSVEAVRR